MVTTLAYTSSHTLTRYVTGTTSNVIKTSVQNFLKSHHLDTRPKIK